MVVKSAFGRKGDVVAQSGDYAASQVNNDSGVAGASLQDALDNLNAELSGLVRLSGDLGGTQEQPRIVGLRSRPIADTEPTDGARLFWNTSAQQWEPKTSAASAGQLMGAAYEVDFTRLPAQTFGPAGSYTIDGRQWWMKGALSSQLNALEPGLGLRLGFLTNTDAGARPTTAVNAAYNARACFLPFAQLPGFNPLAPTIVRWVVTHATLGANAGLTGWGGIVSAAASAAALTAAERDTYHLVGTPHGLTSGTQGSVDCVRTDNLQGAGNATPQPLINANGTHEYGLHLNGRVSYETVAPTAWAGVWTEDPSVMTTFGPWRGPLRPNMGFLFIAGGQLAALPVYIRRLRIEQPGSTITVSSSTAPGPAPTLQPTLYNPVAMYALQGAPDAATLRADRSGNGFDLTAGNGTATPDLITGQTAVLPVSSTRLQRTTFTPALQITGALTITCRMKRNQDGAGNFCVMSGLFGSGNTRNTLWALSVDSFGRLTNLWETTSGQTQTFTSSLVAVPAGIWVYVSFRRTEAGVQTWGVNQTYESSGVRPNPTGGSEAFLTIGNHDEPSDFNFGGAKADLGIWNQALTNEQLVPLFNAAMGF